MAHVVNSVLGNIFTARFVPIGAALRKIDFEQEEKLGINALAGFSWKDMLDFDACTECWTLHVGMPGQSRWQATLAVRHHSLFATLDA